MIFKCSLPCCKSPEANPFAFLPCVTCKETNAHHLCSLEAAEDIPNEKTISGAFKKALEDNTGIQFCSVECASSYANSIKRTVPPSGPSSGTDNTTTRAIRTEDMANSETYFQFMCAGDNGNESRILGAMALGLKVSDGKGGTKMLVNLDDNYWKVPANKPTNGDLLAELDRRRIIKITTNTYPRKTKRDALIAALISTGENIEDAFLTIKVPELVSIGRKRKSRPTDSDGSQVARASSTTISNLFLPTAVDYVNAEDLTFATEDEFINSIQEDISFKEGTTKIDYNAQPKMAAVATSALDLFNKLDYRGIPINSTEAKHTMMRFINEHRRLSDETGKQHLEIKQFVFHFKLKWKPERTPAKNMEKVNLYLCIVGILHHPELKELAGKLLSRQKSIDDIDVGDNTIEGGWDHLVSKCNDKEFEVPVPLLEHQANSEAIIEVPYWDFYEPNFDIGNSIPLLSDGKAMRKILHEIILRPYRTLVDKWTGSQTGNGGDNILLSHKWSNNLPWLTYIYVLDTQESKGETGGLFLYDRSGVVPAEFRVEEGGGARLDGNGSAKNTSSGGKAAKRMKDLEAFFDMAAEKGIFAGDVKPRTVNDIVEDLRQTKEQISHWKRIESETNLLESDSDSSDEEGTSTAELTIMKLKQRKRELKSELKSYE